MQRAWVPYFFNKRPQLLFGFEALSCEAYFRVVLKIGKHLF